MVGGTLVIFNFRCLIWICHLNWFACLDQYLFNLQKLQNNVVNLTCPESRCYGELSPLFFEPMLPNNVLVWWKRVLCKSLIPEKDKFYCPFKDCSALFVRDTEDNDITQSECPICRRLFCAQCKAPWNQGIRYKEFQKLKKNEKERQDIMLMILDEWKK